MADFLYTCLMCGLRWVNSPDPRCPACSGAAIHARALEFGEPPEAERMLRLRDINRLFGIHIPNVY